MSLNICVFIELFGHAMSDFVVQVNAFAIKLKPMKISGYIYNVNFSL